MAGYKWDPLFRIEPRNGRAYYVAVLTAFTDAGGHVKADVRYTPDRPERVTASRGLADARFGWRPEVDLDFQILTMTDQHALAQIADGLMSDGYNVQLSMDGGVTMREVVLSKPIAPKALAGKTFAGAAFELGVKCVELIDALPRMGQTTGNEIGARDYFQNGTFEEWISATNASGWTEVTASGTVTHTQDASDKYDGSYSMKVGRTDAATFGGVEQNTVYGLLPGRWYSLTFAHKQSGASIGATPVRLSVRRRTAAAASAVGYEYQLRTDGVTWAAPTVDCYAQNGSTSWTQYQKNLRISYLFNEQDVFYFGFVPYFDVGAYVWWDGASLVGPILPTGVSLW